MEDMFDKIKDDDGLLSRAVPEVFTRTASRHVTPGRVTVTCHRGSCDVTSVTSVTDMSFSRKQLF